MPKSTKDKQKKLPESGIYFPYCDFFFRVGDQLVNVTRDANGIPDRLIKFNCKRLNDNNSLSFSVDIFDPEWVFIENLLVESNMNCAFQYGWYSSNNDENIGPVWYGEITAAKVSFKTHGSIYTLNGNGSASVNVTRISKTYGGTQNGKDIKISDIVEQVAAEQGWKIGSIDPTETLKVPTGVTTQTEEKRFTRCNETPVEFINRLIPYAVRESDGASNYILSFDDRTSPPTVNFHPYDWENGKGSKRESSPSENRTFNYCLDTESDIMSLSFENDFYWAWLKSMAGGATIQNYTPINRLDQSKEGEKPNVSYNHIEYEKSQIYLREQFLNQHEQAAVARRMMASTESNTVKLKMDIFGDPRIMSDDLINIIIQMPGQGKNYRHPASGTWLITEVLDEISNGAFKTTITCIRQKVASEKNVIMGNTNAGGNSSRDAEAGASSSKESGKTGGQPPAGWSGGTGTASSAYERVRQMQKDNYKYSQEYRFGAKSRDCSSLVMDVAGYSGAISAEDKALIKDGGTAAGITYNLEQKYGAQVTNSLSGIELKEGMIIGIDRSTSQNGSRYQGIDHIAMVVKNEQTGKMEIVDMGVSRGVASTSDVNGFDKIMRHKNNGYNVSYRIIDTTGSQKA